MTNDVINVLLSCAEKGWVSNEPCSSEALSHLIENSCVSLPDQYIDFLSRSNGGFSGLNIQPLAMHLWPCEQVVQQNKDYEVSSYLPDFFAFADNGGNECLVFHVSGEVHSVCLDSLDPDAVLIVADSFLDLLGHVVPLADRKEDIEYLGGELRKR